MRNKVTAVLFCLMLLAGAAAHLFLADRVYSENERRELQQKPAVSSKTVFSGQFGSETEVYLADQFPGRDSWVAVKTICERILGKRESGGVYYADDGYLIDIYRSWNGKQTTANMTALKALQDAMDEAGIPMRTMLVPTAARVLSDKLPPYAQVADEQKVLDYAILRGIRLCDVTEALTAHKDEYIYYKTDHHWTSLGAYYAYAAWMHDRGLTAAPIGEWTKEQLSCIFRGTTYNKVNDPLAACDTIDAYYKNTAHTVNYNRGYYVTDTIYERSYLEGRDQYAVFLNSNQETTVITGPGTGKLLILKDSYANCFAQFTVDDFAETHLIDMRFFRGSVLKYIAENEITEVLVLYNIPNFTSDTAVVRCSR